MDQLPTYSALVLAGGRAARLGGQVKPQLQVGGRTMLGTVLAAVADAERRIVVGPPQPVPEGVVVVREQPPGGGPVAALSVATPTARFDRRHEPELAAQLMEVCTAAERAVATVASE